MEIIVFIIYFCASLALFVYGMNCYVLIGLFLGVRKQEQPVEPVIPGDPSSWPSVTTQIPLYNELNVAEACLRSVAAMDYPGHHEIQILDDSDDETSALVDRIAAELREEGRDIVVVRRTDRTGFKAGALSEGLKTARGEYVAVFDADFVPPPDFLLQTVPHLRAEPRLALVQTRWGHLNRENSLLTRAQSLGIDTHFVIEQTARNRSGLFINFNGTAGIWRKEAISAAGGWTADTLTEDLDLSYRVQLAGWAMRYLPDVVVPAELPETVSAFKSQQFRWAKGSIQTALKLLPEVLRSPGSLFRKYQATIHLTHYLIHPLMVTLGLLSLPFVLLNDFDSLHPAYLTVFALLIIAVTIAPMVSLCLAQWAIGANWKKTAVLLPLMILVGIGTAVSNTRGIIEAFRGSPSAFVRTPKRGEKSLKTYATAKSATTLLEILIGAYCAVALVVYTLDGSLFGGVFLIFYALGFSYIGLRSWGETIGWPAFAFRR